MEAQITNPHGAYGQTPVVAQRAESFRCAGVAVSAHDLVTLTFVVATQDITVKAADSDTDTAGLQFGVALEDIPVGGYGLVQIGGLAYVKVAANTPAIGEGVIATSAPGIADGAALAVGQRATFLGVTGTFDGVATLAPIWLG